MLRSTIVSAAIIAASAGIGTATVPSLTAATPPAPQAQQAPATAEPTIKYKWGKTEDTPGWNCATDGNHVCGPRNPEHLPAGCYDDATLVIPWAKMTKEQKRHVKASPCAGMAPTQQQESDAAYAAAQS
jgi:predicted Fe-S protein YdhL (DUF1289 family)